jgi:hypothetical protein
MRKFLAFLFLLCGVLGFGAFAQQPQILTGDVMAVDAAAKKITIKTKDGETVIVYDDKTEFKRVSAENPNDLKSAVAAVASEISAGDSVVAVVTLSPDKKNVTQTRRVFVRTKGDLAKKLEADREKWTTRGISGKVTAVNPAAKEITVSLRGGFGGGRTTVVTTNDKTVFNRYAANSIKYSDRVPSKITEIKIGDQLRAYGDKAADNSRLTAEEVLFGSFRMVAGKITAIDAAKNEITIKDAPTNKDVIITVNADTLLRRFPPEMAQRLAMFQAMRAASGGQMPTGATAGRMGENQRSPNAGNGADRQNGFGGGMNRTEGQMRGGGDMDSMLERLPALTIAELKIGDAVAASASDVADSPNRVQAIKFVAGIEPFLNVPQIPNSGGRQQSPPQITIPGLDGFGAP